MDPDANWIELTQTLADMQLATPTHEPEARDHAIELLRALADWLERGGFPPQVT